MAKAKTNPKAIETAAPGTAFKRGLLPIAAKFGFFIGGVLFLLLALVAFVVYTQLNEDLTREVVERGNTVARNVATKAPAIAVDDDTLTMTILLKGSVEEAEGAGSSKTGLWPRLLKGLKGGSAAQAGGIRNEGIARVIVIKAADGPKKEAAFWDSKGELSSVSALPKSIAHEGEPYPSFELEGEQYYDISSPMAYEGKPFGTVHLYLRRAVISDSVNAAAARLAGVMSISLLSGLLVLLLVVRLLLKPVIFLIKGVNAVASGNFNVHIGLKRRDELGDLIESYNQMASSLKEKEAVQEALAKYTSKDLVDQLVSDNAQLDLGGSRVHATILFSVVRGMHALSQTMDAEDYVRLVNEYLEVKTDIIMKNGGSIDKFIGDEVMAVWGLRGGDPAEMAYQATKAAVEVQEAVAELNAKREAKGKQGFEVSIGINNGEVVSGNMGSSAKMDFTVLGGNVNLAARLGLVAAQPGQSIISKSVYELVAKRFKVDALDPVPLKGIKEPVPLFWPRKVLR